MTTKTPPAVTIAELMAATGLGPRQARADVKAGLLPGRIRRTGEYVCPRGEFEQYVRGDWQPRPQPTTERVQMVHKKAS